jgi:hypothetical protein
MARTGSMMPASTQRVATSAIIFDRERNTYHSAHAITETELLTCDGNLLGTYVDDFWS